MVRKHEERIEVTPSSGNLFADMGLPKPEEGLKSAQLATLVERAIKRWRPPLAKAATVMAIDQPQGLRAPGRTPRGILQ